MNRKQIAAKIKELKANECGECTLCCELPEIHDKGFEKESYEMCKHCELTKGCKVYKKRPETCQAFMCLYMLGLAEKSPLETGFFAFMEHEMSFAHKVFTIYCKPEQIGGLKMQIKQDKKLNNFLNDGWTFVARMNKNQEERIIITL